MLRNLDSSVFFNVIILITKKAISSAKKKEEKRLHLLQVISQMKPLLYRKVHIKVKGRQTRFDKNGHL